MIPNKSISSHDRLVLFGFGIFETLMVLETGPLFLDLHWNRMNKGAEFLNLKLPNKPEWTNSVQEFICQTPVTLPYALRITLSGGSPAANLSSQLFYSVRPLPYSSGQYHSGISLHLLPTPRNEHSPLVSIKSTNYLENLLAKENASHFSSDEGIWLNTQGYLSEGTMSNLFFLKNNKLFTPSLSCGCLPGTRRQLILELADTLEIPNEEGFYSITELLSADEIFMTNALMGVMPVRRLDDVTFRVSPSGSQISGMRRLETAFKELIISQTK